jgi:hypothetical protein
VKVHCKHVWTGAFDALELLGALESDFESGAAVFVFQVEPFSQKQVLVGLTEEVISGHASKAEKECDVLNRTVHFGD